MSKKAIYICLAIFALGVCCLMCNGFEAFLLVPGMLLIGWVLFPIRVLQESNVNWGVIATAIGSAALVVVVLHFGCRLLFPRAEWTWRRSLALVGIPLLILLAGAAANDAVFHLVDFATMNERVFGYSGESVARVTSANNLKQVGLAAISHNDDKNRLPAGATFDRSGRALHGWQTALLPYLDQQALFQRIDQEQPWNSPANADAMKVQLQIFFNPQIKYRTQDEFALSHYAGNVHVLGPTAIKLKDITDGTSNTMLMGEIKDNFQPWGKPGNWRDPALGLHQSPAGFGGPFKTGTLVVMCDGTVRTVRNNIRPEVMKAIATPRGGENVDLNVLD